MPTPTYVPLSTITLTSTATSVTFSSIPATFRDLILVISGLATANQNFLLRLNGDSSNVYPTVFMRSQGNSPESSGFTDTSVFLNVSTTTSGTRCSSVAQVMDYVATDKHKTVLVRTNYDQPTVGRFVEAQAARYASNTSITSLTVSSASNMGIGSTFSLYGIA